MAQASSETPQLVVLGGAGQPATEEAETEPISKPAEEPAEAEISESEDPQAIPDEEPEDQELKPDEQSENPEAEPGEESDDPEDTPDEEPEDPEGMLGEEVKDSEAEPGEELEDPEAALVEEQPEAAEDTPTTKPTPSVSVPDSISGFLWSDGNGMAPTDWDGLYNGDEQPVAGYTVYLYAAGDLNQALAETRSGADGTYIFAELAPGNYVLGLASATVDDTEYLLPMEITTENKFATDWESDPLMAYTATIELAEGDTVSNINAGLRLPTSIMTRGSISLANLKYANQNDIVTIDNEQWYVAKTDINILTGETYLLLAMRYLQNFNNMDLSKFGTSQHYEGSYLQTRMTNRYIGFPTIRAIAVVPELGDHMTTNAVSLPTSTMAGSETKDIMFALSYSDYVNWNGGKPAPLKSPLKEYGQRAWSRTGDNTSTSHLYGIINVPGGSYNGIDAGLHYESMNIGEIPAVWVNGDAVEREVNVYYVDTNGNYICDPIFDTYNLLIGDTLTLTSAKTIEGYEFMYWQKGEYGTSQGSAFPNPTLTKDDVIAGTDIYLIYKAWAINVEVTKTVTGDFGDKTRPFEFTLCLQDSEESPLSSTFNYVISDLDTTAIDSGVLTLDGNGKATFNLTHGQTITIKDVPVDISIQVLEESDVNYSMTYTDSMHSGDILDEDMDFEVVGAGPRIFSFINDRIPPPLTGVDAGFRFMEALLFLTTLAILAGFITIEHICTSVWIR